MQIRTSKILNMWWCRTVLPRKLQVEILHDLNINSSPTDIIDVDQLWESIETVNGIECTLGTIYLHLKANITKFNDRFYAVPQKINSGKSIDMCYIAGGF